MQSREPGRVELLPGCRPQGDELCRPGDLLPPPGNVSRALAVIEEAARVIFRAGKVPFFLGGEHLLSYVTVRAATEVFPDLVVVCLDAHTDLRPAYLGGRTLPCLRLLPDEPLLAAGVPLPVWRPFRAPGRFFCMAGSTPKSSPEQVLEPLHRVLPELKRKPVYFTLDIDVLDPAFAPGTGAPEPGGPDFREVLSAVLLLSELRVVGLDLVEVAPAYDPAGITSLAAATLIREAIISTLKARQY